MKKMLIILLLSGCIKSQNNSCDTHGTNHHYVIEITYFDKSRDTLKAMLGENAWYGNGYPPFWDLNRRHCLYCGDWDVICDGTTYERKTDIVCNVQRYRILNQY